MKIGFFGALGLIFIVLKLTEMVTWSWWLVLAPLYGPFVLALVIVLIWLALGLKPKVTWNKTKD
jgi:hypothetical protein